MRFIVWFAAAAAASPAWYHQLNTQAPPPLVITGLYNNSTANGQIVIHDINGAASWTWSSDDAKAQQGMPADLLSCIQADTAVPESKWADGGHSVITIYNFAALVINHAPGTAADKQVTFGVCLNWANMTNTHSLELVPDGKLAVATTSDSEDSNIKVFPLSAGLQAEGPPVQQLSQIPAVHGLVWDEYASMLWAVGSNGAPDGSVQSSPALNAYKYTSGSFQLQPVYAYNMSAATVLTTEWDNTGYAGWWDGGHDVTGVPFKRTLLMSSDMDLHSFDIDAQTFQTGQAVVDAFLPGFMPVDSRVGADGQSLPRSDIKCLSLDGNNNALYVQATWQDVTSYQINRLQSQRIQPALVYPQQLYRSRWFADTPAWPKAAIPKPN